LAEAVGKHQARCGGGAEMLYGERHATRAI